MKFVVGLGNPGQKYMNNRHNVGHMFIDYMNGELRMKNEKLRDFEFIKTDCFMNASGKFVKKLIPNSSFLIENLYVAHDDLDIPFGMFKVQFGRGPKVHNGIDSVAAELGTDDFWRIRIGVEARPPRGDGPRPSGEEYVLTDFTEDELLRLRDTFSQVAIRLKTV